MNANKINGVIMLSCSILDIILNLQGHYTLFSAGYLFPQALYSIIKGRGIYK